MGDQFRLGAKQLPNIVFGPLVLLQRIETGQARAHAWRSAPQDFCAKIVGRRREYEGAYCSCSDCRASLVSTADNTMLGRCPEEKKYSKLPSCGTSWNRASLNKDAASDAFCFPIDLTPKQGISTEVRAVEALSHRCRPDGAFPEEAAGKERAEMHSPRRRRRPTK